MPKLPPSHRFLLWVDAVGGFLVCLSDQIKIGQAVPGNDADVAIMGDISRQHAEIERRPDGCFITPFQSLEVSGSPIRATRLLSHNEQLRLGRNVVLTFRQPSPLSASATLTLASNHRLQSAADGVLLMGESCVLGPRAASHIVCPHWTRDLIFFRQGTELFVRSSESLDIDGRTSRGTARLTRRSRVVGDEFSLSLEELA